MSRISAGLLLTAGVAIGIGVLAKESDAQRRIILDKVDRRFDHAAHNAMIERRGIAQPECDGVCHTADAAGKFKATGKREHSRCFEKCHGGFKHQFTTSRGALQSSVGRTCIPCHGTKIKYRPADAGPVNARKTRNYAALYSHKRHIMTNQKSGRQCEGCHGEFGDAPPRTKGAMSAGHEVCSDCHERAVEPAMHQCGSCHVNVDSESGKNPVVKPRKKSLYNVGAKFSHEAHAKADRVGTKGRDCLACHTNIAQAEDDKTIPMPTMEGCWKSCHNGKNGFDALSDTCTRCHSGQKKVSLPVEPVGFVHKEHEGRGVSVNKCASCHRLDQNYAVQPATKGNAHAPCSNDACHASEFLSKTPTICGACHTNIAPWKKQKAGGPESGGSEFASDLSHAAHVHRVGTAGPDGACIGCHGDMMKGQSSKTRGHAACAGCHERKNQPTMDRCGGCHKLGSAPPSARGSEWAVGDNFSHPSHENDPRKGKTRPQCVTCHKGVDKAKSLSQVRAPTMKSCAACHDGTLAFKTTGFGCYRCHQQKTTAQATR